MRVGAAASLPAALQGFAGDCGAEMEGFNCFPVGAGEPTLGSLSPIFSLNRLILEQITGPQRPRCHLLLLRGED